MTAQFRPGDEVELRDPAITHTGTVVMVEGPHTDDPTLWLDMHPAAWGGYTWVLAHFPHSWHPDGVTCHAINKFRASECRLQAKDTATP